MNITKQIKRGQILIIVLVTMMVLGIILISTTSIMIKDSQISQSTAKYEDLTAYAEKMAFQLGLQYANPQKNNMKISILAENPSEEAKISEEIKTLFNTLGWETNNSCIAEPTCYKCNIEFNEALTGEFIDGDINSQQSSPLDVKAIARICDSYSIENAELFKDELLVFNLNGIAKNTIESKTYQISWEENEKLRNIGVEISVDIIYSTNGVENYGTVKSMYIPLNSSIFSNNLNAQNNIYIPLSIPAGSSFTFRLNNLESFLKTKDGYFKHLHNNDLQIISYKQIRIRPIIKSDVPIAMKISMSTDEPQLDRVQGRSIELTLYEQNNETQMDSEGGFRGPQASVISTVPATKFSGLFDYVLKNETTTEI